MGKNLNRHCTKEDIQMAKKYNGNDDWGSVGRHHRSASPSAQFCSSSSFSQVLTPNRYLATQTTFTQTSFTATASGETHCDSKDVDGCEATGNPHYCCLAGNLKPLQKTCSVF